MRIYRRNCDNERVRLVTLNEALATVELIDRPVECMLLRVGHPRRIISRRTFKREFTEISYPAIDAKIDVAQLRDQLISVSYNQDTQEGAAVNEKRRVRLLSPLFGARPIMATYEQQFTVFCKSKDDAEAVKEILTISDIKDFQLWPGMKPNHFDPKGPSISDGDYPFFIDINVGTTKIPVACTNIAMHLDPYLQFSQDCIKGLNFFVNQVLIRFDSLAGSEEFLLSLGNDTNPIDFTHEMMLLGIDTYQLKLTFNGN